MEQIVLDMKFENCPPKLPDIKALRQKANQYLGLDRPAVPKMLESSSEEAESHSSSEDEKFLHKLRVENKRFESLLYSSANDPSDRLKEKFNELHHKVAQWSDE